MHTGSFFFFRVRSNCAVLSILRGRTIDFSELHAVAEWDIEPCKRLGCLLKLGLFENVYIHVDYSAESNSWLGEIRIFMNYDGSVVWPVEWLSWENRATRESFDSRQNDSRQGQQIFLFIKTSTPAVGPTFFLFSGYWWAVIPRKSGQGVKPTIHLRLLSRLKMTLSYTSLPHMSLWCAPELYLECLPVARRNIPEDWRLYQHIKAQRMKRVVCEWSQNLGSCERETGRLAHAHITAVYFGSYLYRWHCRRLRCKENSGGVES